MLMTAYLFLRSSAPWILKQFRERKWKE
jgi:hypothetical protein